MKENVCGRSGKTKYSICKINIRVNILLILGEKCKMQISNKYVKSI